MNVNAIIDQLGPSQREKVEAEAAELIAQEVTWRELSKARRRAQLLVAEELGITQEGVCGLGKRSDLLLATLRKTVRGHGRKPVAGSRVPGVCDRAVLSGFAEDDRPA